MGPIVGIIRVGALTFILSKSLTVFGKKDYADIIKLSGVGICGIYAVQVVNNIPNWSLLGMAKKLIVFVMSGS